MTAEFFTAHWRAKMGIQITLLALCANLHASMPPTGSTEGVERATGREGRATAMEQAEEMIECSGSGRRDERE